MEKEALKESEPFIIEIKNLTDSKIFGVPLINSYYDKQHEIKYSTPFNFISYDQVINSIKNKKYTFGLIVIRSEHDYEKYMYRQLYCPLHFCVKDLDKKEYVNSITPQMDPYQTINNQVQLHKEFSLNEMESIEFQYLMPESKIYVSIFPIRETI